MPKIYLYAEILTHIRQLTLHVSVQSEKQEGTKIDVSTDKKVITLEHDGETQSLYLPTQISGTAAVTLPLLKKTELSARVQIEDENEWKLRISDEIEAPWMAADLTAQAAIQCRHCNTSILEAGKVTQWKDLPSENWAELMDFWFCHKPYDDGPNNAEEAARAKGLSAESRLAVVTGVGMTDLISIVLHTDDCANVKAAETQKEANATVLRCKNCAKMLGTTNNDENVIRLHKSSIAVDADAIAASQSYPPEIFLCSQILSLIEATALKRFVVHSAQPESNEDVERLEPLVLWVFNPDIYFSCSAYTGNLVLPKNLYTTSSDSSAQPNNNGALPESSADHSTQPEDSDSAPAVSLNGSSQPDDDGNPPATSADTEASTTIDKAKATSTTSVIDDGQPQPATQVAHDGDPSHNYDDTSQIYGQTDGPQSVRGELHVEVPLPNGRSNRATLSEIPVEEMVETETPLRAPKRDHPDPETSAQEQEQSSPPTTSSNDSHINLVHRASKVFYKPLPSTYSSVAAFLDEPANASSHEELYLANPADLSALRVALDKSYAMLPASARSFQNWKVGLLDRYEKVPSGLGVMQENPLARKISARDGRVTRWSLGHGSEGLFA